MRYIRTRREEPVAGAIDEERRGALPGAWLFANALRYAFLQQWRQMLMLSGIVSPVIGALGPAAVIGYIAGRSDNVMAILYVFVGASLSIMWKTASSGPAGRWRRNRAPGRWTW